MAKQGKHGSARRIFSALTELRPQSEKAWTWLAQSLEARQRLPEAAEAYRTVIGINPRSVSAHTKLGGLLFKQRRYEEAIAAFDNAIALNPNDTDADISRANALFALGRLPPDQWTHYAALNADLGDRVSKAGSAEFAIRCYQQAIAMKSDLARAHYGLGQIMVAQGKLEDARQCYRRVADIDPEYPDLIERLASIAPSTRPNARPAYEARP
jgi:superkiller protein 3